MNACCQKEYKHIVFLRRPPETLVWGGLEKIMLDWFERIDYSKCKVTLCISSPLWKEFFRRCFSEKKLPIEIVETNFNLYEKSTKLFSDTYNLLKPLKPSKLIFIQGAFTDFRIASVLAGFLVSRNNTYIHENLGAPTPLGKRLFVQRLLNSVRCLVSRRIITLSREIKERLVNLWGFHPNKIMVSYHGINLDEYSVLPGVRQNIRKTLNIPMSDTIFITAARLCEEKRIDRIIEAFDKLTKQYNNIWLLVLGDGHLRQELEQLAQKQAYKNKIIFLGHKDNVAQYLNAADFYVNSSDEEGLCISILEAMACGVICIATHCSGPTELIQNSQAGFLVDKSTEGILYGMQKAIALNPEELKKILRKGIQFVTQYFEVDHLARNTLEAMEIPNLSTETNKNICLSVIISTYNRSQDVKKILGCLKKQELPDNINYEVIIIDNNSKDNTKQVIEEFLPYFQGRLKYLFEARQGKPFALNQGVKEARGEIIVLTDDDCTLENDYLAKIYSAFKENSPEIGFIGGRIAPNWVNCNKPEWFDKLSPEWFKEFFWGPLAILDYGDKPFIIDYRQVNSSEKKLFYGANIAIRREVLLKYSIKFETRLVEDTEIQFSLLKRNIKGLYAPQVKVYHKVTANRLTPRHYYRWYFARGTLREKQEEYKPKIYHPLGVQNDYIMRTLGFFVKSLFQDSFTQRMYYRCRGIFNLGQIVKIARENII